MVEKEGYIFVFGLDKEGSDRELEAYYELYVTSPQINTSLTRIRNFVVTDPACCCLLRERGVGR